MIVIRPGESSEGLYGLCLCPQSLYPSADSLPTIAEHRMSWYWVRLQMNKQATEKRVSHIHSGRNTVSRASEQHSVVEWVGLCRLCGGDH